MGVGDASPVLKLTGHRPGSRSRGADGWKGVWEVGVGSCLRLQQVCQGASQEAAVFPLCPPGCRAQGLRAPPMGAKGGRRMFGYGRSPWCGEGFCQAQPGPGLNSSLLPGLWGLMAFIFAP